MILNISIVVTPQLQQKQSGVNNYNMTQKTIFTNMTHNKKPLVPPIKASQIYQEMQEYKLKVYK